MNSSISYDVVIVGGGPAGSTCGGFLKKYAPELSVGIFERETFPREHVGESQLPLIGKILDELGVWQKVEDAGFPVKIGATYRWGNSDDLWDFNFIPHGNYQDEERPATYTGQRTLTAFQVDRSIYDKILLDHAEGLGCVVHQGANVREVVHESDRIQKLVLDSKVEVTARLGYVDASGHAGVLRRNLGIGLQEPSSLKNIAVWDYWTDAEWAVTLGKGGTRVQVMSLGYGWLWFIPITDTRTSIGLVCPADYYKRSGLTPEQLYLKAIADEPRISALTADARRENCVTTTKDWSFVADRLCGENWFLAGESASFADPVLAAGMSLAHASARETAYCLIGLGKGRDAWLRQQYDERNRRKIFQHIKFADYWYTANGHFSELKEFTREIAEGAGLELDAEAAFRWLGTGGFVEEDMGEGGLALFSLDSLHHIARRLSVAESASPIDGANGFILNLKDADQIEIPAFHEGQIMAVPAYKRGNKILPLSGYFGLIVAGLRQSPTLEMAVKFIAEYLQQQGVPYDAGVHSRIVQSLEAMTRDGWVKSKHFAQGAPITVNYDEGGGLIDDNRDHELPKSQIASHLR